MPGPHRSVRVPKKSVLLDNFETQDSSLSSDSEGGRRRNLRRKPKKPSRKVGVTKGRGVPVPTVYQTVKLKTHRSWKLTQPKVAVKIYMKVVKVILILI